MLRLFALLTLFPLAALAQPRSAELMRKMERDGVAMPYAVPEKNLRKKTNGKQSISIPGIISINRIYPDLPPVLTDCLLELDANRKRRGW